KSLGRAAILRAHPRDIGSKSSGGFQPLVQAAAATELAISLKYFVKDQRNRPNIDEQVMKGQKKAMMFAGCLSESDPHQGSRVQIKPEFQFFGGEISQDRQCILFGYAAQIQTLDFEIGPAADNLKRFLKRFPFERRSEDRVPLNHLPPCLFKRL